MLNLLRLFHLTSLLEFDKEEMEMAATQYQIFCKYYHSNINKVVNNVTPVQWVQAEDNPARNNIDGATSKPGIENCWIRPEDGLYEDEDGWKRRAAGQLDNRLYELMTDETNAQNPKYDMIFVYDGITSATGSQKRNPPENDRSTPPIVYYERMRRIDMTPWFLYATCASLNVAMTKAGELVNLIGKDNVLIGKVVSLDQYIEIV